MSMGIRGKQAVAGLLAVSAAVVGGWAEFAPRSFYHSFPGFGRHWVSRVGPYNEHLIRDVGGLYLALLVITVWALLRALPEMLRMTGGGWLVFNVAHIAFHAGHLDGFSTGDKVGQVVALAVAVGLAVLLVLPDGAGSPTLTRPAVR
jgi:hypothetical protein